ncbi:MAG: hypothetical protein J7539_09035 [Niabella sp.]|nr:hypothetical protein [Niabella sp.]
MKKVILIIQILTMVVSSNAQRTISLDSAYNYWRNPNGFPDDVTYVKDVDNKLDRFVGIWKGFARGRSYELHFTKITTVPKDTNEIKWDQLVGKVLIKDSVTGTVIYNSLDSSGMNFTGFTFKRNQYNMSFTENTECGDGGDVFIMTVPGNNNKLWFYIVNDADLLTPSDCPGGLENYRPLFPFKKAIYFDRQ